MAAGGLLALLDDIVVLADDVATMTATATRKTAGIIGDDIAVNAKQVMGVRQDRENYVVKQLIKGSVKNKAILVPAFFGMSLIANGALIPFCLLAGATYLCYEGSEKVLHALKHSEKHDEHKKDLIKKAHEDPEASEKQKIKRAITTDFVLSAEIIAIGLGSVTAFAASVAGGMGPAAIMGTQLAALTSVAAVSTAIVYGPVWGFLRMDNLGLALVNKENKFLQNTGHFLVEKAVPMLSKGLSIFGTAAMFAVGGELFMHNLAPMNHTLEALVHSAEALAHGVPLGEGLLLPMAAGVASGVVVYPLVEYGVKPAYNHVINPLLVKPVTSVVNKARDFFRKNEPAADEPALQVESEQQAAAVANDTAPEEVHSLDTDTPAVEQPAADPREALTRAADPRDTANDDAPEAAAPEQNRGNTPRPGSA